MDFINIVQDEIRNTNLYSHCIIEDVINWGLNFNKKGNIIVKYFKNENLIHSYKEATIIYFHYLDNECIYIGSTIDFFNRMGCIQSAGSFQPEGKIYIPVSNGGKNKDTLVKFYKLLSEGKKLKTYAIAFYIYNNNSSNEKLLDNIPLVPLKEQVEYYFIYLFEKLKGHKPLFSEGLDQNIAYGI